MSELQAGSRDVSGTRIPLSQEEADIIRKLDDFKERADEANCAVDVYLVRQLNEKVNQMNRVRPLGTRAIANCHADIMENRTESANETQRLGRRVLSLPFLRQRSLLSISSGKTLKKLPNT